MTSKYDKKKKELAAKGMPDPVVKKNVTGADKKAAMGKFGERMKGYKNLEEMREKKTHERDY